MTDKKPTLLVVGDTSEYNYIENVRGYGDMDGVRIEGNARNNVIVDVSVTTTEALTAINEIKGETLKLQIDEKLKLEIIQRLEAIEISKNNEEKRYNYQSLMSSIADHVTVLTPIIPALLKLGLLFTG